MEAELLREALNAETTRLLGVVLAIIVFVVSIGGFLYARELRKLISDRSAAERGQRETIIELTRAAGENAKQQADTVKTIGLIIEQNSTALTKFATALDDTQRNIKNDNSETRAIIATLATSSHVEETEKRILSAFPNAVAPISEGLSAITRRVDVISDTLKTVENMARGAVTAQAVGGQIEAVRESVDRLRIELQTVKADVIERMVSLCEAPAIKNEGEDERNEQP